VQWFACVGQNVSKNRFRLKIAKTGHESQNKMFTDVRHTENCSPKIIEHLTVSGTGTFVRAMETCTRRKAFEIGKPSPYVCDAIIRRHKVDPKKTLMIGDRQVEVLINSNKGLNRLVSHLHCRHAFGRCLLS
jgi:phosphoglycolate phosphatase-like HAD superfamily hydrolase